MILFNLGFVMSSGRRVKATMDVIDGWSMQRCRTAEPTVPVEPVRMTFMLLSYAKR